MPEHVDVLIVGAGLSGIGVAHHLQERLPDRRYAILEARDALGGTWDLFRYPGVRSDSDMHTLGYRFRPWTEALALADGPAILDYVRATAREDGSDRHIRFGHRVVAASWSTPDARWTVRARRTDTGEEVVLTCSFLFGATGYFDYDAGHSPAFAGRDRFAGPVVHPQHWPVDLDWTDRRVVVIGSGATAVTLVPALARRAAHVTMLQRSPTYVLAVPSVDPLAGLLRRVLGRRRGFAATRWKNIVLGAAVYRASRRWPDRVRAVIRAGVAKQLPEGYAVDTHFNPTYDPWDQRLCLAPDGDLFAAIGAGRASVVTDVIDTFTETGVRLASGAELAADVIVTATGLELLAFGGMALHVDGEAVAVAQRLAYKGMMLSGVPNFAFAIGYTNASWTLKVDLTAEHLCRLLAHMDRVGARSCVPENHDPTVTERPLLDFQAGYVLRALDAFPKAGSKAPWRMSMSYLRDVLALRHGRVTGPGLTLRR